jgi:lipoate synthase
MEGVAERPAWLVQRIPARQEVRQVEKMLGDLGLNTVCRSASCPNIGECFGACTATFLILGGTCTRRCRYCAVPQGVPRPLDKDEAAKVAEAVARLKLRHAVITSVTRDDLADGGAGQFAACIAKVRGKSPHTTVEVLVPDFKGDEAAVRTVLAAQPEVFNHNIETVPRLFSAVRPGASYRRSLAVLGLAGLAGRSLLKSGIMVGLGETADEVVAVFGDLFANGVRALTVGQYLRPSPRHVPVREYVHPDQFAWYKEAAEKIGFSHVASGPLVRSSYQAAKMYAQ